MYRIGLLAPFRELPGELGDAIAVAREPATHWQVITAAEDSHVPEALRATGANAVLRAGVERLLRWRPDVIAWACTSGSFIDGRARALEQVARLERFAGVPVTSTSLAFAEALAALGADAVAVVAPYPAAATEAFVDYLGEWGVEVGATVHLDRESGSASELLTASELGSALETVGDDLPIVVPDTAVWGIELWRALAPQLAAPLLVANQVTLWQAFALVGMSTDVASFGPLRDLESPGITRVGFDEEEEEER